MALLDLNSAVVRADPYPHYRRLRDPAPMLFDEEQRRWLVTGYAEVIAILRDPRLSVEPVDAFAIFFSGMGGAGEQIAEILARWLFLVDGPFHSKLRGIVSAAFAPLTVEALRRRIADQAKALLRAAIETAPFGRFDVIAAFANPLPAVVMLELLGLAAADWSLLKGWSDAIVDCIGSSPPHQSQSAAAVTGMASLHQYILDNATEASGKSALMRRLSEARSRGELTEVEFVGLCTVLLSAGMETTADLIGNALFALLELPGIYGLVCRPMSAAWPMWSRNVCDLKVRCSGPCACRGASSMSRATEFARMNLYSSFWVPQIAIRVSFSIPTGSILRREDNRHIAFGHGIHACFGASLARLEARLALQAVFTAGRRLTLADEPPVYRDNSAFRGLRRLIVNAS